MTLDEAIKREEEVADGHDRIKQIKAVTLEECKRASEHRQLAEWLKDYRRLLEQKPCEDIISRQAVLDKWENTTSRGRTEFDQVIMMLPPVAPQPKIGYWIDADGDNAICSCCNRLNHLYGNYCKHCGVKMTKQESEYKE